MASTQQGTLLGERFRFEEINMPEEPTAALARQPVGVKVLPEEQSGSRCIGLKNPPLRASALIDDGAAWSSHWPVPALSTDADGRKWKIPRDWRHRRIKLPGRKGLLRDGLPPDMAEEFAKKVVKVKCPSGLVCPRRFEGVRQSISNQEVECADAHS